VTQTLPVNRTERLQFARLEAAEVAHQELKTSGRRLEQLFSPPQRNATGGQEVHASVLGVIVFAGSRIDENCNGNTLGGIESDEALEPARCSSVHNDLLSPCVTTCQVRPMPRDLVIEGELAESMVKGHDGEKHVVPSLMPLLSSQSVLCAPMPRTT
jgi:hypothetical protein